MQLIPHISYLPQPWISHMTRESIEVLHHWGDFNTLRAARGHNDRIWTGEINSKISGNWWLHSWNITSFKMDQVIYTICHDLLSLLCLRKHLSVLVSAGLNWISNHTYGSVYYSFSTVRGCSRVFFLFSVIWRVFLTCQWEAHASLQTQAWNHIYKVVTPSNTSFFTRNSIASC